MSSEAIEDYLKSIYELQGEHGKVSTSMLAARMGLAPPSVTGMLKKLAAQGLVDHRPYQRTVLTEAGRRRALAVIRRHRLAETFLAQTLQLPLDAVHAEAHKWEHVLSPQVVERLDALLGHPTVDPHGAPIPTRDGKIVLYRRTALAELAAGQSAVVAEVSDHDAPLLRYLDQLGLLPKARVLVLAREPFDGPISLQVGEQEHMVGSEVARQVFVRDVQTGTVPFPDVGDTP
jgi:DtxR family Mn-dependent transcriptional regulator